MIIILGLTPSAVLIVQKKVEWLKCQLLFAIQFAICF